MNWPKRVWRILSKTQINLLANSLSFTTLLSLIPFLAVVFALIGALDRFDFLMPRIEGLLLDHFRDTVGPTAVTWVKKSVGRLQGAQLGIFGVLFLILGSLQILRDLDLGVQLIFSQKHKGKAWKRYLGYWGIFLGFPLAAAVFVTLTAIPIFGERKGFFGDGWMFVFFILVVLNKGLPPVKVPWRAVLPAALVSLVALFALQFGFQYFTKKVFNYSKVYGSFAALPVLMIYLLLAWYAVLAGIVINSSLAKNGNGALPPAPDEKGRFTVGQTPDLNS